MNRFLITLFILALNFVKGSIYNCPSNDPCKACNLNCNYVCVTIPAGSHYASLEDQAELVEEGYKGFTYDNQLSYRVVFHKSCLTYICVGEQGCESDQNKLFGITRGTVPVMDKRYLISTKLE
jgi:hypothetical protein